MTRREFMHVLKSTHLFGENACTIGAEIFNASNTASPRKKIKLSTMQKWMDETRLFHAHKYFPEGKVNVQGFMVFFASKEISANSWKEIQKEFKSKKTEGKISGDCAVDLDTNDRNTFFQSLLIQFQRLFDLPETSYENYSLGATMVTASQDELSLEDLRDVFIGYSRHYKIMGIINRNPPKLTRDDAIAMDNFADGIDSVIHKCKQTTDILYTSIKDFKERIQRVALELDANINIRFSPDDSSASYNMADEDTVVTGDAVDKPHKVPVIVKRHNSSTPSSTNTSRVKIIKRLSARKTDNGSEAHLENKFRKIGIPELTPEFVQTFAEEHPEKTDSIRFLVALGIEPWQHTIKKLNYWHDYILKWKKDT